MAEFHSTKDAKEFLVAIITNEAQRENVPLSDVERKMLYFSETGWTLPDIMDVADEFERTYDESSYEKKIASLIRSAGKRLQVDSPEDYKKVWSAIRFLNNEDHYISVMTRIAGLRAPGSLLRSWGTGYGVPLALCFGIAVWLFLSEKFGLEKYAPTRANLTFLTWALLSSIAVGYTILHVLLGGRRADALVAKLTKKLFGFLGR